MTGITIAETANQGTDLVLSSLTYLLASNLENLSLTGSSAINGTADSANNVIIGNSGNNTLDDSTERSVEAVVMAVISRSKLEPLLEP